jgi:hypothetical protein
MSNFARRFIKKLVPYTVIDFSTSGLCIFFRSQQTIRRRPVVIPRNIIALARRLVVFCICSIIFGRLISKYNYFSQILV